MSDTERAWIAAEIQRLVAAYGAVPPPWQRFPNEHPLSIGWRMGAGESHIMFFGQWWDDQHWDEAERITYFRRWSPPPCWLEWMIDVIWELRPWDHETEVDYQPYFERVEQLGFGTRAEFEADFNDPKWFEDPT